MVSILEDEAGVVPAKRAWSLLTSSPCWTKHQALRVARAVLEARYPWVAQGYRVRQWDHVGSGEANVWLEGVGDYDAASRPEAFVRLRWCA